MIRIYLQYSYGGFKTLYVEGTEKELLNQEVTNDNDYGFPNDAHCNFQYGGAKMMYRYLNNGELDLVIREIPSIHTDGDGRSIPCAVQFIGAPEDRNTLDHMATKIANNIDEFHEFFKMLFRVRGGLRIDGDNLREWIDSHNVPFVCDSPVVQIKNISTVKSGVILFVPLSKNFGIDATVTSNVSKELRLPADFSNNKDRYIGILELGRLQGKSNIAVGAQATSTFATEKDVLSETSSKDEQIQQLKEQLSKKDEEISKLRKQVNDGIESIRNAQQKTTELQSENEKLTNQLAVNNKIIYAAAGIAAILGLLCIYSLFK